MSGTYRTRTVEIESDVSDDEALRAIKGAIDALNRETKEAVFAPLGVKVVKDDYSGRETGVMYAFQSDTARFGIQRTSKTGFNVVVGSKGRTQWAEDQRTVANRIQERFVGRIKLNRNIKAVIATRMVTSNPIETSSEVRLELTLK